ncbi:hypothetical protein EJ02DRAFT_453976 [Clathrospora elynae]|uniref:Uncharacterized protein n=1 Tax=Clathrospora elynae TaxID=706981 RepID=A0A6A5T163_9PLEO|nr:hypothetical protein EJ02DRAFT_453976 [Clathrospora elynae]
MHPGKSLSYKTSVADTEFAFVVVAVGGMNNDIRQSDLQIATGLMTASTMIPFVSFGASQTPLTAPLISYLAGVDPVTMGYVAGLIPTPVATLGGLLTRIGAFIPLAAAWQSFSDGTLGINSKWAVLPNPASGPGVYPEAVDMKFTSEADQAAPRYSLATWRNILNMPYIQGGLSSLGSPRCVRNTNFFTNSTAQAKFRSGNVTFGSICVRVLRMCAGCRLWRGGFVIR